MNIIADTHCHTVASTHAYSTALELINEAKNQNLFAIAITDHGKAMPASPGKWYFKNLHCIPKVVNGIRVLSGIEANVVDSDGNLDNDEDEVQELEWMVASMHDYSYTGTRSIEACTNAWLNVCKEPKVTVIGHCEIEAFKFDYQTVLPEFGKSGKLVEINNNSFKIRRDSINNCVEIAKLCKKHSVPVIINSDAHFCLQVGKFDNAIQMLKDIDFPEELIVNSSIDRFKAYLQDRGIKC